MNPAIAGKGLFIFRRLPYLPRRGALLIPAHPAGKTGSYEDRERRLAKG